MVLTTNLKPEKHPDENNHQQPATPGSTLLEPLHFAYCPVIGKDDANIYLLHQSLSHLEKVCEGHLFLTFNKVQPTLLRKKLQCGMHNVAHYDSALSVTLPLYTSVFRFNIPNCHLQMFSDDTAIVGCASHKGMIWKNGKAITDFIVMV